MPNAECFFAILTYPSEPPTLRTDSPHLFKGAKAMFNDSDRDKLDALSKRIGQAQDASEPKPVKEQAGDGPLGRGVVGAIKLGSDFVALILGMAFFGWLADRQMGSAPWIMLVMVSTGFIGGFWMMIRALVRKPVDDDKESQNGTQE